ncbi:MAG: DUF5362 domain-containing protein [Bacteroidales bacterium]|nr:DUF5362 domain-containing protein [Bacteroidales bacterium]
MEESRNQENSIIENNNDLVINQEIKSNLLVFAKWGRFLGIICYVSAAFMLALGAFFIFAGSLGINWPVFGNGFGSAGIIYGVSMFFLMAIYGIVYIFIGKYLLGATKQTKLSIETNNQEALVKGTDNLKKLFTLLGIITIIGLCIMVLYFIFIGIAVAFFV